MRNAADMLIQLRDEGDERTVAYAVPAHKLGADLIRRWAELPQVQEAGLVARVWRGREAEDPDEPGEKMCCDIDAVIDAQKAGANVDEAVCRDRESGKECPFYSVCGYQRQKKERADIWFMAHEILFTQKPQALGDIAVVIVDEAIGEAGLLGTEPKPTDLAISDLAQSVRVPIRPEPKSGRRRERKGEPQIDPQLAARLRERNQVAGHDVGATKILKENRDRLCGKLNAAAEGPLRRSDFADYWASEIDEHNSHEWRRKMVPNIYPGMPLHERQAEVGRVEANNRTIRRTSLLLKNIRALVGDEGPELSGWAEKTIKNTDDGAVPVIRLRGRRAIGKGFNVPTLIIDANLRLETVRHHWPQVKLVADVDVEAPNQRVYQVSDCAFSKARLSSIRPLEAGATDEQRERHERNARRSDYKQREIHAAVASIARRFHPRRVLVAIQKGAEEDIFKPDDKGNFKYGPPPPNVVTEHHNNFAGRDEFKDVAAVVIIGRTQPSPYDIERTAKALTGSAIAGVDGWYPSAPAYFEMSDGSLVRTTVDRHPDPTAEALRWLTCEGELLQIKGRAREVNRAPTWDGPQPGPVEIFILTNVPLPIRVDQLITLDDIRPKPADLMLAAGGIAFENSADAAAAYPELWDSEEAAKKALQREPISGEERDNPLLVTTHREMSPSSPEIPQQPASRRIRYQLAGQRQHPAFAWVDLSVCSDPRARLTGLLGELALYDAGGSDVQADGPIGRMAADGYVLFSPTDAVQAHRDIFATHSAAKEAIGAARKSAGPLGLEVETHERMLAARQRSSYVVYRPPGRGQQNRLALCSSPTSASAQQKLEAELGPLASFQTDRFAHMTQGGDLIIVPGAGDLALTRPAAVIGEPPTPPEPITAATPEPIVLTPEASHLVITGNQPTITIDTQPLIVGGTAVQPEEMDEAPPPNAKPWHEELTVVCQIDRPFFGFDQDIPSPVPVRHTLPRAIERKLNRLTASAPTVSTGEAVDHTPTAESRPFEPPAWRDLPITPLTDRQRERMNEPFWIDGGVARPEAQRRSVYATMAFNTNWLRN
jgi:putative DNA primase/helicase